MANSKERWTGQPAYDPLTSPQKCYESFIDEDGMPRVDAGVAVELGVSKKTLWEWRGKYPEFKAAYEAGKSRAEAAYSKLFTGKAARSENFSAPWVTYMHQRSYGTMADIERDASETDAEKLETYKARVQGYEQEHEKPQ